MIIVRVLFYPMWLRRNKMQARKEIWRKAKPSASHNFITRSRRTMVSEHIAKIHEMLLRSLHLVTVRKQSIDTNLENVFLIMSKVWWKIQAVSWLSLTHWGRVTQICVFNTRLFSLHNTLNYAIHGACLRKVLLTDVYINLTSLWINL